MIGSETGRWGEVDPVYVEKGGVTGPSVSVRSTFVCADVRLGVDEEEVYTTRPYRLGTDNEFLADGTH